MRDRAEYMRQFYLKHRHPCADCGVLVDMRSTRCYRCAKTGELHPNWKGDNVADPREGRSRAQRILRVKTPCHDCGAPPKDRHHIDENPLNNALDNLVWLCRKCHWVRHGRGATACSECGLPAHGQGLCNKHYRRWYRAHHV